MPVILTIENETSLPDGGPLSYTLAGKRGIDIGRDAYLDWALPDPTKTVSGKHCEIRYRDGAYWLHDVSRNGTFLNRSAARMQEPHRLRNGDRLEIGRYIIVVQMDGEDAAEAGFTASHAAPGQYWDAAGDAAPPISPKDLRAAKDFRPVQADFREWAIDVPPPTTSQPGYDPFAGPLPPSSRQPEGDMGWAQGPAPAPAAPEPYLPVPTPRRPSTGGADPWGAPQPAAGAAPSWGAPPPASAAPPDPGWAPPPPAAAPAERSWAAEPPPPPLPKADAGWAAPPPAAPPPPPSRPAGDWAPAVPTIPPPMPAPPTAAPAPGGAADNPWGRPTLTGESGARQAAEPPPPPPAAEPSPPRAAGPPGDFVARLAKGAGVSPEALSWRDPGDLAEEIGALLRLNADSVKQLLAGRAESKRVARTGSHTMIQAMDNNPLKFSPTVEDALRIMLSRPSGGYLDARKAFEQSFKDLKTHQVKTYSAMQHALRLLMEDLDPATIEKSAEGGGGIGGLLGSKKAKLWDLYVTRWNTLTSPHEDGMVDAFMMFFAECYDRGGGKG